MSGWFAGFFRRVQVWKGLIFLGWWCWTLMETNWVILLLLCHLSLIPHLPLTTPKYWVLLIRLTYPASPIQLMLQEGSSIPWTTLTSPPPPLPTTTTPFMEFLQTIHFTILNFIFHQLCHYLVLQTITLEPFLKTKEMDQTWGIMVMKQRGKWSVSHRKQLFLLMWTLKSLHWVKGNLRISRIQLLHQLLFQWTLLPCGTTEYWSQIKELPLERKPTFSAEKE